MSSSPQVITENIERQLSDQGPAGGAFGASATDLITFYGGTPVAQNTNAAANTHTPAAGATTSVYVNTTFDGGITGTNYTVGDIVTALKRLNLIKS